MYPRLAMWLALLLFAGRPVYAQIYPPINTPVFRALDANGKPLAGGKLYSYAAGTSTPQATYAAAAGGPSNENPNPVILDSAGQAPVFLGLYNYKFILTDANGVQQWSVDNISGQPLTAPVTSVFGRTGAINAQTGDYSCGQVTGAICAMPPVYYQTAQNAGADLTQRSKINFIAGSNVTVSCVDNSGANRTDCTFTANIPAVNVVGALHDVTSERSAGVSYQNTNPFAIYVSGYYRTQGSSWSEVKCLVGPDSPSSTVSAKQYGATTEGKAAGFECMVPAGHWYQITYATDPGSAAMSLAGWFETYLH